MNLSEYLRLLRRRWAVLVLVALLGLGVSAAWLSRQTPEYTSTAATYVSVAAASNISDVSAGASLSQVAAKNFAEIATSPYILNRVVSDLHLAATPTQLAAQVEATAELNTSVISITATSSSPATAAAIANTVAVEIADAVPQLNPNVGNARSLVRATQIQTAQTPSKPSSPQIPVDLALGLLAGLALAIVIVVARDAADSRVVRPEQLSDAADAPLLGVVPQVRRPAWSLTGSSGSSRVSDAFLALRTKIQYSVDGRLRAMVVASPDERDTAGQAVAQLAESFARSGERVLVIDAQSASHSASRYFGVEGSEGLVDVLAMGSRLENVIHTSAAPNIWVLLGGELDLGFSEQIRSDRAAAMMTHLQQLFGVVLIAADPLLSSQDGAVLSRLTDGALVVCRGGHSTSTGVSSAIEVLDGVGARKLGVALVVPHREERSSGTTGRKRHRSMVLESAPGVATS